MVTLFFRKKREGVNSIEMVFAGLEEKLISHVNVCLPFEGASPVALFKNIIYAYKHKSSINHITGEVHYIAIGLGHNTIMTVHDVKSALNCKNPIKRLYILLFWFWIPALIVRRITVISEFTKRELVKLVPFAKNKIFVVHNAFNQNISFLKKDIDYKPIILHMGTKQNKNLERVVEALVDIECRLIIIGKLSERQIDILRKKNIYYDNKFDISYDEVIELYQKSDIVSFPSFYEGFGVPILEANAAGRPIIVGDIPVLHEVAGKAACFVNPYSVESIKLGFLKILNDKDYRTFLVEKGFENIKRFAPEAIAREYNRIYKG